MNEHMIHVIKDPVHGTMQFSSAENNWIKPFIDSPHFQRLRHIKQLGLGDFIFPGAVHTRFNHCLGCSYIASQIARKIGLSEEECQLVVIACLLHDIGHGPFSHAFEDIFHNKLIRHEDWTPFFLADYKTNAFFTKFNRLNPRHPLTEEKFLLILEMIMHQSQEKRVLNDIVSSQLDADRLDYLLRDSHFCGVTYGEFDLRWLLNCMSIVNTDAGERLGITHKGIGAIEHYLMARRLMTRNIYHNQKKLAFEYFLVRLLRSLSESLDHYVPYAEIKNSRLGKFLLRANIFNQTMQAEKNRDAHKQQFLKENFNDYKELCDYDVFSVIKFLAHLDENHAAADLAKRIHYREMPKIIRLDYLDMQMATNIVREFKSECGEQFQDWQITLIKTPHQAYSGIDDPILVVNEHERVMPINEMSLTINAISDKFEHTAFLCVDKRIFDDKKVVQLIEKLSSLSRNDSLFQV